MATSAFGRNLRCLREQAGLTQAQLGDAISVSEVSIYKWEKGEVERPKQSEMRSRLLEYFGVTDAEMFGYNDGYYAKFHGLSDQPAGATAVKADAGSMVPVRVLGTTFASSPDDPIEYDDEAMLYDEMARRHPHCFALRVNGSCMDLVFTDHDYIFVDPDMELRDGSIAVMLIDGKSETRRVKLGNSSMVLVSESHDPQPDIILQDGDGHEANCQGVVFWWQAREELA